MYSFFFCAFRTYIFLSYNDIFLKCVDFCKPKVRIFLEKLSASMGQRMEKVRVGVKYVRYLWNDRRDSREI